ncbi:MAG: 16S rRNA (adenine(1518)-N(6)/adenine(1519)-N(6))-dimethyltransferase RsmA [Rhabdochlamydiaceae bacterium]|nr:16S rRNA (adenine(1518)-N(6)/adenine(1519)-N(6))-dimethyltransferase RsmA [Candidatus Amphrikana amoebophyrae]
MFKRTLSQNFLIDPNTIEKLVNSTSIDPNENVLEIGPGKGAITRKLASRASHLIAVEKDRDLIFDLEQIENAQIYEADVLEFDLNQLRNYAPMKVVSNLPYHITSKILKRLALHKNLFKSIYVMVQEEFANRLILPPETTLTAFLNSHYNITKLFNISKHCFYPKPNVTSTFIELKPNNLPMEEEFYTFLNYGYLHKRKMLYSELKHHYDEELLDEAFQKLGLDEKERIQKIKPDLIFSLYKLLGKLTK